MHEKWPFCVLLVVFCNPLLFLSVHYASSAAGQDPGLQESPGKKHSRAGIQQCKVHLSHRFIQIELPARAIFFFFFNRKTQYVLLGEVQEEYASLEEEIRGQTGVWGQYLEKRLFLFVKWER